jgi:acyl dehydratase
MNVGDAFRTGTRTVTETDLVNFISSMGFNEPLFYDARHSERAGYKGRLIPGALTFYIAEGLVMQTHVLSGTGVAFMHMDLDAKQPVYVGDTLCTVVTATESRPSSRPGCGVVTTENRVFNQNRQEVLVYRPVRLIRGRDFETAAG